MTWNRWGDVIIDCGRELDAPRQIVAGRMLYRDIRYPYGPAAPYFNALLYRLFGIHVNVLTRAGLIVAALVAWLVYRVCRLLADRWVSCAAAVLFLYAGAFAQLYALNIYCFPLPYAFAATYGMLAEMACLYFSLRCVQEDRWLHRGMAAATFAAALLCKIEVAYVVLVIQALFLLVMLKLGRLRLATTLLTLGTVCLFAAGVYGWFYWKVGPGLLSDNLLTSGNVAANSFTLRHSGLANPVQFVIELIVSLVGFFVMYLPLRLAVGRTLPESKSSTRDPAENPSWEIGTGVGVGLIAIAVAIAINPYRYFRALPLLLLLGAIWNWGRFARGTEPAARSACTFILFGTALQSVTRIFFRCGAEHYGFYLMTPAIAAFAIFWPRELAARSAAGGSAGTRIAASASTVLLLGLAGSHAVATMKMSRDWYGGAQTRRVTTPFGTMAINRSYGETLRQSIEYLATKPPGRSIVVWPEGAAITFLAGGINPLGMFTFLPLDFCGSYDEPSVVSRLDVAAPEFIVVVARDTKEYDKEGFGVDFATDLVRWCSAHYRVEKTIAGGTYAVRVLARSTGLPATTAPPASAP